MSALEVAAFMVSVLGVWLVTRRSLWNFPFSLASVLLYGIIFYQVKLYADMSLQAVFAGTLLYGLWQWTRGRRAGELAVARVTLAEIAISVIAGAIAAFVLGGLLSQHTDASLPWADSSLLAMSLIGSVWTARRKIETWWVWIFADTLYVILYLSKHLYLTALLYGAFVVLAIIGLRQWQRAYQQQALTLDHAATATVASPLRPASA